MKWFIQLIFCAVLVAGCDRPEPLSPSATVPVYTYEVVAVHPHDPRAFTQGLQYHQGYLFESTGLHGQSSLRKVDLESGHVLRRVNLPDEYFGEGIALDDTFIYMLTWRSGIGFVFDRETFRRVGQFAYQGEGWGLAYNGEYLIMSDGTSELRFLDTTRFEVVRRLTVRESETPVPLLNELAWVEGEVWANVFKSDRIARIDPDSGEVVGWIDFGGLLTDELRGGRRVDVFNGVAYDSNSGRIWVTGKLWPALFEIRIRSL
jgi:glutamine cyclotransferase